MLTFRTVRQALLYDLKLSICHVIRRLLRKIDYTGNFYGLISGTRLLWEDMWSRYFICPCQRSHQYQSFSQSNPPLATSKRESLGESRASLGIILGFHAFILVFYFHLVTFWVLGKLPTGRPWPTPWLTPWPRPWPTPGRGFVPTRKTPWKIYTLPMNILERSVLRGRGIYITSVLFSSCFSIYQFSYFFVCLFVYLFIYLF